MRYLLFTLLGFFGPALLMLFLRLLWFRIRYQWAKKSNEPEIIDITPRPTRRPSKLFVTIWICVSLACTAFLIWQMDDQPASKATYIPAHINADGNFVPAISTETPRAKKP